MTNRIISFALLLFIISSCNVNKYSQEDIDAIVEKTNSKLKDFTPTQFQFSMGIKKCLFTNKGTLSRSRYDFPERDL